MAIVITPPHSHIKIDVLESVGIALKRMVGSPIIQGDVVAGMQGIGVKTPECAAVAAATIGFEIVVHFPKGKTFKKGAWSWIFAAGLFMVRV